jgi:hypothetical protein
MGLPAIGLGISAAGQLFGAHQQSRAQNQARDLQLQRMGMVDNLARGMMQQGPTSWENTLAQYLPQFAAPGAGQGGGYNQVMIDAPQMDIPGVLEQGGFNAGQDALMQFLRRDPSTQMPLDTNLEGILSTGNPFDVSQAFDAYRQADEYQTDRALAELQGSSGSLGARFGSANQRATGDLLAQLSNQRGVRNAQIAQASHEAAQGRRLGAAGLMGQLEGQRTGQMLQGVGLGHQGTGLLAQLFGQNAGLDMQAQLANQQGAQFGAGLGQNAQNQLLQALQLGGQMQGQRSGMNAQLLAMMAGMGAPGANPAAGMMGQTIGGIGQGLALLPFMDQIMRSGAGRTA